jgi:putative sigma-54 modulation protein
MRGAAFQAARPPRRSEDRWSENGKDGITMNVEITGRHIVITPAIQNYVLNRLRKFARILGEDLTFHVIIDVEKQRHTAEILLKSKLLDLTGKGETADMYSSIIRAIEKLERQALKQKSKIIETKRQRAKAKSVAVKSGVSEQNAASTAARRNGIHEEEAHKKPMAVEEALMELGHSDYPFIVFRNVESGSVNVLYRRKDGSLGLIHT